MTNINPYLFHYNTDINGNLQTVKIDNEKSQASPLHFAIQMSQIPKKGQGIVVLNDKNEELYEVNKRNKISSNSYWVDYNNGIIYLDSINAGKVFTYSFHGIGWEFISCSRIVDFKNVNGQTIRETLQEIIDKGRECIDALNTIGNAIELLKRIENYILVATELDIKLKEDIRIGDQLHIDLTNDISTGSTLHKNLTNDITVGDQLHNNLTNDISTGTTLDTNLKASITEGNTTKSELDKSRLEAQNDIATIKATGNGTWTIPSSAWVGAEPNLTYTINHKMNSKDLIVAVIDTSTQKSVMADYRIVDMNNIEMQSMEATSITVTINAKYYSGKDANIIAQEVIDARGVEANLKTRLDKYGTQLEENTKQLSNTNYLFENLSVCKHKKDINNALATLQANQVYAMYDELMTRFPIRITKAVYGQDDFGNDLAYYEIKSKVEILTTTETYNDNNSYNNNVKQLILTSGVHGDEHCSVQGLYMNIKDILEEATEYEKFIGDTTKIIVMPVVNPSGFNKDSRTNGNGVDINRNFDINWDNVEEGQGTIYYKGPAANSEKETKFVIAVCEKYKNTLTKNGSCIMDFHDFAHWANEDKRVFWFSTNTPEIKQGLMAYTTFGEKIVKEFYPYLTYEQLNSTKYNHITTAESGNLIAYVSKVMKFNGCLIESCTVTRGQGNGKYFKEEQEFTYMNIYGALNFISKFIGKGTKNIITSLTEIGCSLNDTLETVIKAVPSKAMFIMRISSDSVLRDCLPWDPDHSKRVEGVLIINKSTTNDSVQASVTLNTVSSLLPHMYSCSYTEQGLVPWVDLSQKFFGSFSELGINSKTDTLQTLINTMPSGSNGLFSVTSADTAIYEGTPKTGDGLLSIEKLVSQNNIVKMEYMRVGSNQEVYKTWGNKSLGIKPWKELQYKV